MQNPVYNLLFLRDPFTQTFVSIGTSIMEYKRITHKNQIQQKNKAKQNGTNAYETKGWGLKNLTPTQNPPFVSRKLYIPVQMK